jgi:hypothetical protein
MSGRIRSTVLAGALCFLLIPQLAAAQRPDTLGRRRTADEMHAQRRAWLDARRSGAMTPFEVPGLPPVPFESLWTGWRWTPLWPYGWAAGPGAGYMFGWPGMMAGECVIVSVRPAGAPAIELPVSLRSLGIADAADLDLAIEARLARGLPVDLYGIYGRRVRLEPGMLLDDLRVRPCESR